MDKSFVVDCDAIPAQRSNGAFQVDGVPKDDGSDNEVETTRPIALILETAVTQVTLPVQEDGASEGVSGLALIGDTLDEAARFAKGKIEALTAIERSIETIAADATESLKITPIAVPFAKGERIT